MTAESVRRVSNTNNKAEDQKQKKETYWGAPLLEEKEKKEGSLLIFTIVGCLMPVAVFYSPLRLATIRHASGLVKLWLLPFHRTCSSVSSSS